MLPLRHCGSDTHVARPAPDVERELKAHDEDTLVDLGCTLAQRMFLALVRVERRVFFGVVVGRDISGICQL